MPCVWFRRAFVYAFGLNVSIRELPNEGGLKWNEGNGRVPWSEKREIACQRM